MPLPPELDQKICNRFAELIAQARDLLVKMKQHGAEYDRRHANSPVIGYTNYGHVPEFQALVENLVSLTNTLPLYSDRKRGIADDVKNRTAKDACRLTSNSFLGYCKG